MPEAFSQSLVDFQAVPPLTVLVRLVAALLLGGLVALVYRFTRPPSEVAPSFSATLVLLSILIAMVTQVIGDNVARAFSLVGALSIVRFRTVVRDTQDTAFVIFSVGVGMAVGAGYPWLAVAGITVVSVAAFAMNSRDTIALPTSSSTEGEAFELQVRVGIGHDPQVVVGPVLDVHATDRRLMSLSTARQGLAVDATFRASLRNSAAADALLRALNTVEGVQSVNLTRLVDDDDD
ncbi:MAG TPA: DUF4956 domain-containing protein [Vicinamibacterales bacterium]|nr:DUF4956 domain-containing protein [Vicinamibacterales bacterium]